MIEPVIEGLEADQYSATDPIITLSTYLPHTLNYLSFQRSISRGQNLKPIGGQSKVRKGGNRFVVFKAFRYGDRPVERFEPLINDVIEHRVSLFVRHENGHLVVVEASLQELRTNPSCPAFLQGYE